VRCLRDADRALHLVHDNGAIVEREILIDVAHALGLTPSGVDTANEEGACLDRLGLESCPTAYDRPSCAGVPHLGVDLLRIAQEGHELGLRQEVEMGHVQEPLAENVREIDVGPDQRGVARDLASDGR